MFEKNPYIPFKGKIKDIVKHTNIEWTFTVETNTEGVRPGQFYEISIPKFGESPISVSGIGCNTIDFTIRNVGKVTEEIFKYKVGDIIMLRGPYGNGFNIDEYINKDLLIVVGGSALAPVRGIIQYVYKNKDKFNSFKLIAGFKTPEDILFKKDLSEWSSKLNILVTVDKGSEDYEGAIGLVTKYIPELEYQDVNKVSAIVVGPPMMMKFSVAEIQNLGIKSKNIWVSYERKMHCGIGKCGHCKMDDVYICIDGPVFNYEYAKKIGD